MKTALFADTFYWISLTNPEDASHRQATLLDESPTRPIIITTEEVLTEFLTFFSGKGPFLRAKAVAITRSIFADTKGYSLTDCISMQSMRARGITGVLTDDHHFEQEGFHALFRNN